MPTQAVPTSDAIQRANTAGYAMNKISNPSSSSLDPFLSIHSYRIPKRIKTHENLEGVRL